MYTLQCTTAAVAWGPDEAPTDLLGFLAALRSRGPVLQKVAEMVSVHHKSWAFEYLTLSWWEH